jgi:RNA polymerase sigma factor (sigma-70 family)
MSKDGRPVTDHQQPDTRALQDELLAVRCQLGEREAFDQLTERWHQPLWRYARRVTGSDDAANEVAQDVWVRVLRGIARLREPARLRSWLFGIAHRSLMDRLRGKYATAGAADIDVDGLPAPEADHEIEAELESLEGALARLPVVERDVLTLFYLRELTLAEVADTLQVPVGTVKSRLFRARNLLRQEVTASTAKGAHR